MNSNQTEQTGDIYLDGQQHTGGLPNLSDNEFPNEGILESDGNSLTHNKEEYLDMGKNSKENLETLNRDNSEVTELNSGTSDEETLGQNQDAGEYNRDHEGGMIEEIGETEEDEIEEDETKKEEIEENDLDDEDDDEEDKEVEDDKEDDMNEDINADSDVVENIDVNETNRPSFEDESGASSESRYPKSI